MSLSKGFAAVLRTVRAVRGFSQQDLGDAGDRKHLWLMEKAKSSPTLNKFEELSQALQFDPVTILALCVSQRDEVSPAEVIKRVQKELAEFERLGGLKQLADSMVDGEFKSHNDDRSRKLEAIQECKRAGLTPKETIAKLGFTKSTVYALWKLVDEE